MLVCTINNTDKIGFFTDANGRFRYTEKYHYGKLDTFFHKAAERLGLTTVKHFYQKEA